MPVIRFDTYRFIKPPLPPSREEVAHLKAIQSAAFEHHLSRQKSSAWSRYFGDQKFRIVWLAFSPLSWLLLKIESMKILGLFAAIHLIGCFGVAIAVSLSCVSFMGYLSASLTFKRRVFAIAEKSVAYDDFLYRYTELLSGP